MGFDDNEDLSAFDSLDKNKSYRHNLPNIAQAKALVSVQAYIIILYKARTKHRCQILIIKDNICKTKPHIEMVEKICRSS